MSRPLEAGKTGVASRRIPMPIHVMLAVVFLVCGHFFISLGRSGQPDGSISPVLMEAARERLLMLCGYLFLSATPGALLAFLHAKDTGFRTFLRRCALSSVFAVGCTLLLWSLVFYALQPKGPMRLVWLDPLFFLELPIFAAVASSVIWLEATRLRAKIGGAMPVILFLLGCAAWFCWIFPGVVDALLPAMQPL